jgi:hypothetical protein
MRELYGRYVYMQPLLSENYLRGWMFNITMFEWIVIITVATLLICQLGSEK